MENEGEDEEAECQRMLIALRHDAQKKLVREHLSMHFKLAESNPRNQKRHLDDAEKMLITAHRVGLFELVTW